MRLVIAVPAYRVARVRDVAPSGCVATIVERLDCLDTAMRATGADIAIFDPLLDQPLDAAQLIQTVRSHPCARWLLYTPLRPDTARLLLDLGGAGVRTAVFAGVDDSARHLGTVLGELVRDSITHRANSHWRTRSASSSAAARSGSACLPARRSSILLLCFTRSSR